MKARCKTLPRSRSEVDSQVDRSHDIAQVYADHIWQNSQSCLPASLRRSSEVESIPPPTRHDGLCVNACLMIEETSMN